MWVIKCSIMSQFCSSKENQTHYNYPRLPKNSSTLCLFQTLPKYALKRDLHSLKVQFCNMKTTHYYFKCSLWEVKAHWNVSLPEIRQTVGLFYHSVCRLHPGFALLFMCDMSVFYQIFFSAERNQAEWDWSVFLTAIQSLHRGALYLGRGFTLLVLPILLAIGVLLVVARLIACAFNEGHVVIVGAGGPRQDAHEVTVVAQVLQQAGHPTGEPQGETRVDILEEIFS